MKLICDGLDLSDAISKVSKALPQRVVNPVLEGIKITAEGETLTLYATDSEFSVERKINAEIIEEGEILVPGRIFSDYIKKLTDEQIELSETEKNRLRIRYNESEGYLQCLDKEDYPDKTEINREKGFHILESELRDVIGKTQFSASTDDSRQILKGCLFEIEEYTLTVVALDGYRLALAKKALEQKCGKMSLVIPSRALSELSKLLGDGDRIARLFVEENLLVVEMENTTVSTRLLSGEYINYRQIIPEEFTTNVIINKQQFEAALDRASLLSRGEKNNLVKFDVKENIVCITGKSELGNIKENVSISLKGKDLNIAFNAKYISDCLRAMDNDFVKMNFTSSVAPCIITPCETDEYLYLVLPVRMVS
ncbi:MAG: DNA polymerase III subunit beta [Clostridia bacterium]|nr:DNA polymerase III subunit beta [Clostridia bacterium]